MAIFRPVRYRSINSFILVLACVLLVSFNVHHVQAQGPIMTIYDINDQVNHINETIDQLNIQDVRIYDERLDGIEELLRTAFLDIGERFQILQNRLDEIEVRLNDVQSKIVNPLQTTHWISPFYETDYDVNVDRYDGVWQYIAETFTYITLLNIDTTVVDAVLYIFNKDGSLRRTYNDITIPVGEVYKNTLRGFGNYDTMGHLEITATGHVVPHGYVLFDAMGAYYDDDSCCLSEDGEWGYAQSYSHTLLWYPKSPNPQDNPDPID